ncbi:hypothetical protein Trydic_g23832 [Trypoxylus dichotomus]
MHHSQNQDVQKLGSRWIPHNVTLGQKRDGVEWYKDIIQLFNQARSNQIYNLMTSDKSKQESTDCAFQSELKPAKAACFQMVKQMVNGFSGFIGHWYVVDIGSGYQRSENADS